MGKKRSVSFGGNPNDRMSAVVSGDERRYGGGRVMRSDFAGNLQQGYGGGGLGMPVNSIARNVQLPRDESRVYSSRSLGGMKQRDVDAAAARTAVYSALQARLAAKKEAPPPKIEPTAVVRTTTTEKLSPVKAQPKAPMRVGNRMAMLEKNVAGPRKTAAGKNVSYGFASMKDMARSAGKSIGGMAGGMRSGGGRATDPSRGGMGNSGRGTGSKK